MATTVSISGSGNVDYTVYGRGTVIAGNGNDSIDITGKGKIIVGSGHDTLTLGDGGKIMQFGSAGVDTINIGSGHYTIFEQGQATVISAFGYATVSGGVLSVGYGDGSSAHGDGNGHGRGDSQDHGVNQETALSGHVTLVGSSADMQFAGGSGWTLMHGGTGNDTFVGGSGHDTMIGGSGHNLFEFQAAQAGGHHVIQNFVSGQDQLYIEGHSLDYLISHHDVTTSGGNTFITIDGGQTTIELQGVTSLNASDFTHNI